jgi:2-(1,2-epoxy-1,2-dihydrophenyl)acetyl-CoA isomerase
VQDYKNILMKKEDRIVTITLNRPERMNALTVEMTLEIIQALEEVGQDSGTRVVVFTGAGRAFCVGADLNSPDFKINSAADAVETLKSATQIIMGIRNLSKPVIAAVNGAAVGGGCNLAIACDIVIASDKAKFSEVFVQRGLHPDWGGTYHLPRLVGAARARELMLTGRLVDAVEADRIGLVTRVVPAEQLADATRETAVALAKLSPLAMGMIKSSLNRTFEADLPTMLDLEAKAQSLLFLTEDFREGLAAFFEKREADYKGK